MCIPLLPLLMAGCTVNKVWVVKSGSVAGGGASATDLRSYAHFAEIKEGYRIEGMIGTAILPIMKNEAAAREAVLRDAAAGLGVNTLVGVHAVNEPYGNYGRTCAVLANTGVQSDPQGTVSRPRFLVCMPPVNVKTTKSNLVSRLELDLLGELQSHLMEKGYYVYPSGAVKVEASALTSGKELPAGLIEVLGVAPDFVLICEIGEGKELGLQTVEAHLALYDLQTRKLIWDEAQPVVKWGLLEELTSPGKKWFEPSKAQMAESVHEAVVLAVKQLPTVSGFERMKQ